MYDYLIVGAGLFGSVFARQATDAGKKVLVIDKRPNIAGTDIGVRPQCGQLKPQSLDFSRL